MTLATGPTIEWLVEQAATATDGVNVNNGTPFTVSDGEPDFLSDAMFIVGLSEPPPNGQGAVSSSLSRQTMGYYEAAGTHQIPFCIDVRVGGRDASAPRTVAEQVLNAWWLLVATDPSCGQTLPAGSAVGIQLTSTPSSVGTTGEPGTRHLISGQVTCNVAVAFD